MKDVRIKLGEFWLQGWIGWGPREAADVFVEVDALKTVATLRKLGYAAARAMKTKKKKEEG